MDGDDLHLLSVPCSSADVSRLGRLDNSNNILLLIFLIGVVQVSDVLQYVWGKLIGGAKSCLRFPRLKPFPAQSAAFCRLQPLPR